MEIKKPKNLRELIIHGIAPQLHLLYKDESERQRMYDFVIRSNDWAKVRDFLLANNLIEPVNYESTGHDILKNEGEKAKELGGYKEYEAWKKQEERKQRITDFPKNKWFIYEPSKAVIIFLILALVTFLIKLISCSKHS